MLMPKSPMQSNSAIKTVNHAVEAVFHCRFCHYDPTSNIFTVWHMKYRLRFICSPEGCRISGFLQGSHIVEWLPCRYGLTVQGESLDPQLLAVHMQLTPVSYFLSIILLHLYTVIYILKVQTSLRKHTRACQEGIEAEYIEFHLKVAVNELTKCSVYLHNVIIGHMICVQVLRVCMWNVRSWFTENVKKYMTMPIEVHHKECSQACLYTWTLFCVPSKLWTHQSIFYITKSVAISTEHWFYSPLLKKPVHHLQWALDKRLFICVK